MATVYFNERIGKKGKSFPIYYVDPFSKKKCYYKACHSKKEAVAETARLRVMIDNQEYCKLREKTTKKKIRPLKFSELAELCMQTYKDRVEKKSLRMTTYNFYADQMKQVVKKFGKTYIFDLSREDIDKYRTKVALEISNLTSNNRLRVIKAVFKRAVKEHAIAENIVSDLTKLSEKQHVRTRYLSASELNNLVKSSLKTKAKFYLQAVIYLASEHGASKQEILDLKWSDIDFYSNTIYFNRIKNGVSRTMYLMPRTKQSLLNWKNHLAEARRKRKITKYEEKYVFCQVTTGKKIKEFRKGWENAKKIAKLDNFHFHDLRHTYASNILTAGGDLKDVKDLIGHKDIASTDRYTHLTVLRKSNIQKQLAEHYANA